MEWIWKGIGMGLFLSILVGPLLFALIQEGLERGFRAGISVGVGIWISDLLFILGTYHGVRFIAQFINTTSFQWSAGIAGAIILFIIGIGMLLSKAPVYETGVIAAKSKVNYFALAIKGFLINTINPFTVAFWTGLMTTVVFASANKTSLNTEMNLTKVEATMFLGTILMTIITTDTLKVLLAKKIRPLMKPENVLRVRRVAGMALIIFGIVMLGKVLI